MQLHYDYNTGTVQLQMPRIAGRSARENAVVPELQYDQNGSLSRRILDRLNDDHARMRRVVYEEGLSHVQIAMDNVTKMVDELSGFVSRPESVLEASFALHAVSLQIDGRHLQFQERSESPNELQTIMNGVIEYVQRRKTGVNELLFELEHPDYGIMKKLTKLSSVRMRKADKCRMLISLFNHHVHLICMDIEDCNNRLNYASSKFEKNTSELDGFYGYFTTQTRSTQMSNVLDSKYHIQSLQIELEKLSKVVKEHVDHIQIHNFNVNDIHHKS